MPDAGKIPEKSHDLVDDTGALLDRLDHLGRLLHHSGREILEAAQDLIVGYLSTPEAERQLSKERAAAAEALETAKRRNRRNRHVKTDLEWLGDFLDRDYGAARKSFGNGGALSRRVLPFVAEACARLDDRPVGSRLRPTDVQDYLRWGTLPPAMLGSEEHAASPECPRPFHRPVPGIAEDCDVDGFFNAVPQRLDAMAAGCDVERSLYVDPGPTSLRDRLFARAPFPTEVFTLTGPSGSGKTILLDRICHDALQAGWTVFRAYGPLVSPDSVYDNLQTMTEAGDGRVLVAIDAGEELLRKGVSIRDLTELSPSRAGVALKVVVTLNNAVLAPDTLSAIPTGLRNLSQHVVGPLDDRELRALVDKLLDAEGTGRIRRAATTLTAEERLERLDPLRDRVALIALLNLRYGKNARDVVREEYVALPRDARQALGHCALMERLGSGLPSAALDRAPGASATRSALRQVTRRQAGLTLVRHPRLVLPTLDAAYPDPAARADELVALLLALDNLGDRAFHVLSDLFRAQRIGRKILSLFKHDRGVVATFIDQMDGVSDRFAAGAHASACLAFLGQLAKDALGEYDRAAALFERAASLSPDSAFIRRQLVWSLLKAGRLDALAVAARRALSDFPDAPKVRADCAYALSNTLSPDGIATAIRVIGDVVRDDPKNAEFRRRKESIDQFERVLGVQRGDALPDWALEGLSINRMVWRVRTNGAKHYRDALFGELRRGISEMSADPETMREIEEVAVDNSDKRMRALLKSHTGRYQYQRWYVDEEDVDLAGVRTLFEGAIQLWPEEPFAHCWLGTYLKEVERDLPGAMARYEASRKAARVARAEHVRDHPMILNNMALAEMDMVRVGLRDPEEGLAAAAAHLRIALERLKDNPRFTWPLQTRTELRQLFAVKGMKDPFQEVE